jgi:hypothetical protein
MSYSPDTPLEKGGVVAMKDADNSRDGILVHEDGGMAEKAVSGTDEAKTLDLPPVDGGHKAWLFLAGCFVMEALVFGAVLSSYSLRTQMDS